MRFAPGLVALGAHVSLFSQPLPTAERVHARRPTASALPSLNAYPPVSRSDRAFLSRGRASRVARGLGPQATGCWPWLAVLAGIGVVSCHPSARLPPSRRPAAVPQLSRTRASLTAIRASLRDVPPPWTQYETEDGQVYFYNPESGESVWELPASERSDSPAGDGVLSVIIDDAKNPYVTSKADRMRREFGEQSVKPINEEQMDSLAADIARLKRERGGSTDEEQELSLLDKVINTLGTVLTYNFFIIITFFLWFLVGVGLQYGANDTTVIGAFKSFWDVLILPLLTTHMTLTFLSAGLERIAKMGA